MDIVPIVCMKLAFNPPRQCLIKQKFCPMGKAQTCCRVNESITGDINKLQNQNQKKKNQFSNPEIEILINKVTS